jgi:hypothetical protein
MSNILKTLAAGSVSGEYQISRSLRFNSADSAYLSRTPASAGSRTTWTFSCWLKRSATSITSPEILGAATSGQDGLRFNGTTNRLQFFSYVSAPSNQADLITTQVFRDYSAWYNIVAVWDTENATSTDRVRIYINGSRVSDFDTEVYPGPSATSEINNNVLTQIGVTPTASNYLDGYLADIYFIDGAALTADSFGEVNEETGVWTPIKFSGTYGTNGFYLNFSDNSDVTAATLGADDSGNGNNWTPSGSPGFSVTAGAGNDSLVDTPTPYGTDTGAGGQVRGNYCTLNPLTKGAYLTLSNGNLQTAGNSAIDSTDARSTFAFSTGKWYWEFTPTTINSIYPFNGIIQSKNATSPNTGTTNQVGIATDSCAYLASGSKRVSNSTTAYGNSYTANDVIGVAVDADNGALYFSKNGTFQNSGVPTSGASKTGAAFTWTGSTPEFVAAVSEYNTSASNINFGQRPFAYTAPSGFKALVTTNLPEPTVVQGDDYFNTVLYTGTGAAGNAVTGVGFAPDWVWLKSKSQPYSHTLYDVLRGRANALLSDGTSGDVASAAGNDFVSFDSDGFTVGTFENFNTPNNVLSNPVAWCWKAGVSNVINTDGTVAGTVTVSANTTAGFSIVTWTNPASGTPTIGHGLGVAPSFIIVKDRTFAYNWDVGCDSIGWANRLNLNTTGATSSGFWNSTAPTASVFTYAASGGNSGDSMVAYCFAAIPGFSAFGSYTGNGLADGPFVYTGFRPAFLMVKRSSSGAATNWIILDTSRDIYNLAWSGTFTKPS